MKKIIYLFLLLTVYGWLVPAYSQNQHKIDSLLNVITKFKALKEEKGIKTAEIGDSVVAKLLFKISIAYWGNHPDKAMDYANQCLEVAQKIGFKKSIASAYTSMGVINKDNGKYPKALEYYQKALDISIEIKDKKGVGSA